MDAPQPNDGPDLATRSRGAIARWLLTDRMPRSALGILGISLALWIFALTLAFLGALGETSLLSYLCVMLAFAAGFLAISGLARIRGDFRKATTAARKAVTLIAVLPLTALAALSLFFLAVIALAVLQKVFT